MKILRGAAGILAAISLILILLISSIELAVYGDISYFEKEYTRYQVTQDVQMEMDDLMKVTREMLDYLRGDRSDLHINTIVNGEPREFFNEREIAHMEDVQGLFLRAILIRRICIAVFFICLVMLAVFRAKLLAVLSRCFAAATAGFVLLLGGLTALISTDFTKYFTLFHKIFFDNDLWLLDPRTDLLINIVPEPFFVDMALRIALIFGAAMIILFTASILFLFFEKHQHTNH